MYEQSSNIILLIVGVTMLMVIVIIQCATGKRTKRINLPNSKSKVTQASESSSQSVKKVKRLQKKQIKKDVEDSSQSLSKKNESIKESPISKRSQTDQESSRSNKSKTYCKKKDINNQSNEPKQKDRGIDVSAKVSEKSLSVIPAVNTATSKNIQIAKLADTKPKSNEEIKGVVFKEQEQSTQENIGLIDEQKEQALVLEPKNLRWTGEGGYQTVQLRNITNDRLAIKAKCSDNQLYRVNPVFGFINPGEKLKVDIMRRKAVPKIDKMIFVSVRANKDDIFPRPLFKRTKDSQKVAMLPLLIARMSRLSCIKEGNLISCNDLQMLHCGSGCVLWYVCGPRCCYVSWAGIVLEIARILWVKGRRVDCLISKYQILEAAMAAASPLLQYPTPDIDISNSSLQTASSSQLSQTNSNISNQQQIVTNNQYQPYYLRPGYRFKTNLQPVLDVADGPGRRLRKNVANVRRHIDYIANVLNHFEARLWQHDARDRGAIQPDILYQNSAVPPTTTIDKTIDCVLNKFVRAAMNKVKCPIYSICWTPEGKRLITGASTGEFTLWNGTAFNFETILQFALWLSARMLTPPPLPTLFLHFVKSVQN